MGGRNRDNGKRQPSDKLEEERVVEKSLANQDQELNNIIRISLYVGHNYPSLDILSPMSEKNRTDRQEKLQKLVN